VIVPELLMPPEMIASLVTNIPLPVMLEVIWPALLTLPPIVLLLMVMPVLVEAATPVVMTPLALLVMLPLKDVPVASIQVWAPLLVNGKGPV
jgi:hypothetical protein